jgi:hypothetical protein
VITDALRNSSPIFSALQLQSETPKPTSHG